jgi:nitrogen fixation protein NifT
LGDAKQERRVLKVMIRRSAEGALSAYVPKKDLEEPIVEQENPALWGGSVTLANGWVLQLPEMAAETTLPVTVEARRLSGD